MRQIKSHLLSKTMDNHRLERIDISQIPKVIEEFYLNANTKYKKQICENNYKDEEEEEESVQVKLYWIRINHFYFLITF